MLKWFRADLHIHTCLSPCSELTMSPKRIVKRAKAKKLDMIAITDHNSADNTKAAVALANKNLAVIPGMEITSKEEVHVIALFDKLAQVLSMQELVYASLPESKNKPDVFGEQLIVNEHDEIEGNNDRLLITATNIKLKNLLIEIKKREGLTIASHVDRPAYGVIAQLGFIPDDIEFDALEVSTYARPEKIHKQYRDTVRFAIISSSDAHDLKMIGKAQTDFYIAEPNVAEIKKALLGLDDRTYKVA